MPPVPAGDARDPVSVTRTLLSHKDSLVKQGLASFANTLLNAK